MKPRLIAITGPAAYEVGKVFCEGCRLPHFGPSNPAEEPWWDEVRDFDAGARRIFSRFAPQPKNPRQISLHGFPSLAVELANAICAEPGGEEFLVGLVLPVCPVAHGRQSLTPWRYAQITRTGLPARLVILAPDPPKLLMERVKAWGGDVWWCLQLNSCSGPPTLCYIGTSEDGKEAIPYRNWLAVRTTWPEAVRAALGET